MSVVMVLVCSCGNAGTYIEGPKEYTGSIGTLSKMPDQTVIQDMGDNILQYMIKFNFSAGINGQLNPLNAEQTDYILQNETSVGMPQINPDYVSPGKLEIVFSNGPIAILDKVSMKLTSFELPQNLIPPIDIEYLGEKREMTQELAEKIARIWFDRFNFDLGNYKLNKITIGNSTSVVFTEKLEDPDVSSPNYVRAVISYWGMIEKFDIVVGPKPTIGTKPTLDESQIIDKAKSFLALPAEFNLDMKPYRVIKRLFKEENGKLNYTDKLAWFVDASGYKIESRNQILTLDGHSGLPIQ
jgi:hypothetical protein